MKNQPINQRKRLDSTVIYDDIKDYISTITELSNETESPRVDKIV